MNYYDELGISSTASSKEIRQAYHRLVRLMHPDHQNDAELQRAAAIQMQRLNIILNTLTDPRNRRYYDLSIDPRFRRPAFVHHPVPRTAPPVIRLWLFGGAGMLVGILVTVTTMYVMRPSGSDEPKGGESALSASTSPRPPDSTTSQAARGQKRVPKSAAAPVSSDVDWLRVHGRPATTPESPHSAVVAPYALAGLPLRTGTDGADLRKPADIPPPPPTMQVFSGNPPPAVALVPVSAPPPVAGTSAPKVRPIPFSGTWRYVDAGATIHSGGGTPYAPEFVQLTIQQDANTFSGSFQSRYRVGVSGLLPDVNFRFRGVVSGDVSMFTWTGDRGNVGQGRLRVISPSSIEVTWSATHTTSLRELVSGRAVLVHTGT